MKKAITTFVFISCLSVSYAQHKATSSIICCGKIPLPIQLPQGNSGLTGIALLEAGQNTKNSFLQNYYGIDPYNREATVGGVLKIRPFATIDSIAFICTNITEVTNRIYSFTVRLADLSLLTNHPDVEYTSLSRKAELQLNNARHDAGVDKVQAGVGLPMPYTGKGVITGLVDVGIEYIHPSFKTDNGDTLRILRVWAQNQSHGKNPTDYKYGSEFVGSDEITAVAYDSLQENHGTIVTASLAAGAYGSNGKYASAAPCSRIIAITSSRQERSLLDGASYFFKQTKKLQKRSVLNLSWGSHIGPHDGTSLFDQAIDSLVGQGNIIVGAAGNWGIGNVHIKHVATNDSLTTSSLTLQGDTTDYIIVDIWGKPNSSFQVQLKAIDKITGAVSYTSRKFSTLVQRQNGFLVPFGKDTSVMYVINTTKNIYNNRPNSTVAVLHNHVATGKDISVSITTGPKNEVHAWCAQNAWFTNTTEKGFVVPGYVASDNQYSVSEIGGTSKSIITVGAHVSHNKYTSLSGTEIYVPADSGNLCPFSGQGPTLDGRTKPDLTAPGSMAVPSNSFTFDQNNSDWPRVVQGSPFVLGNRTYYWFSEDATSFSAPFVAGSIALLLEADPTLSFQQIKNALIQNTTVDQYTGTIPSNGSLLWGFGKLNLYKAISSLINVTTGIESDKAGTMDFWCSNPVSNAITVYSSQIQDGNTKLKIVDILGNTIVPTSLPLLGREGSFYNFDTSSLKNGQYIGILYQESGMSKNFKITKIN